MIDQNTVCSIGIPAPEAISTHNLGVFTKSIHFIRICNHVQYNNLNHLLQGKVFHFFYVIWFNINMSRTVFIPIDQLRDQAHEVLSNIIAQAEDLQLSVFETNPDNLKSFVT